VFLGLEGALPTPNPPHPVCHLKVQSIGPWSSLASWHCGSFCHPKTKIT